MTVIVLRISRLRVWSDPKGLSIPLMNGPESIVTDKDEFVSVSQDGFSCGWIVVFALQGERRDNAVKVEPVLALHPERSPHVARRSLCINRKLSLN